jgi:hypothetical protein
LSSSLRAASVTSVCTMVISGDIDP